MDIAGKVFIVTGGASGLGEGTARMLVANGGIVWTLKDSVGMMHGESQLTLFPILIIRL